MYQLLHGDSLDLLKTLPDNSVDAVVTDPPYGLSKEPDIAEVLTKWMAGEDYTHRGGGFMGKSWDSFVPGPSLWREVLRVLKPGGHLLCFAGTRTVDLMGISLRLAGFEIRDYIEWVYASGFPKSHNVSKAIDKLRQQVPAEVLLPDEARFCAWMRKHSGLTNAQARSLFGSDRFLTGKVEIVNTATKDRPRLGRRAMVPTASAWEKARPYLASDPPAWVEDLVKDPPKPGIEHPSQWKGGKGVGTEGDNEWAGWGTALKPAHEPIIVARKPLEGTVAANVLKWGTGAINIDGCRIGSEVVTTHRPTARKEGKVYGEFAGGPDTQHQGRWPANFVLSHHPDCEETGELTERVGGGAKASSGFVDGYEKGDGFVGKEVTSPVFSCVPGCPVAELDRQSGVRSGGASRFFYVTKPSKKERNAGLDGFEEKPASERYKTISTLNANHQRRLPAANVHPTVKPIALMRELVRLVTPPGGTVLDPFVGSGTTGIAATTEGFDFIGIDQDADYLAIARARIEHWLAEGDTPDSATDGAESDHPTLFG